eukprot:2382758-Rhodomonas_salina.7
MVACICFQRVASAPRGSARSCAHDPWPGSGKPCVTYRKAHAQHPAHASGTLYPAWRAPHITPHHPAKIVRFLALDSAVHLHVHLGVPIRVVDDDCVRGREIEPQPAGPRTEDKSRKGRLWRVEDLNQLSAGLRVRRPVLAVVSCGPVSAEEAISYGSQYQGRYQLLLERCWLVPDAGSGAQTT